MRPWLAAAVLGALASADFAGAGQPAYGPPPDCDQVEIAGEVVLEHGVFELKVFQKSRSETTIQFEPSFQLQAAAYLNRAVLVQGQLIEPVRTFCGKIKVTSIHERLPDPLRPRNDSGFRALGSCPGPHGQ